MSIGITVFQIFICIAALITVGVLQTMAAIKVKNSLKYATVPAVQQSFNYLVGGASLSFVSVLLAIGIMIAVFNNREKLGQHMSALVYTGIVIISILLLTSGALGVRAAITLQCYADDISPNLTQAWNYATITSLVGIIGVFIMLIVQFFVHTDCGNIRFQTPITFGEAGQTKIKAEMKGMLDKLYY